MCVADGRGEDVDPGFLDEGQRGFEGLTLRLVVGAVIIFNTSDGLDLALDGCTDSVRFLDDLDCLSLVFGYRHFGCVEQHRIPPVLQAFGDDVSVRAVIEVKCDRNLDAGGHRPPHAGEHLHPDTADGLDRGLHDHR